MANCLICSHCGSSDWKLVKSSSPVCSMCGLSTDHKWLPTKHEEKGAVRICTLPVGTRFKKHGEDKYGVIGVPSIKYRFSTRVHWDNGTTYNLKSNSKVIPIFTDKVEDYPTTPVYAEYEEIDIN